MTALALSPPNSACAQQDKPELPKLKLAVGGKSAIFYLPLSVTERLGYFKDAGLEVEIADVQSGARALQSLVGGSTDVGVGTFDHTIQMQAKSQPVVDGRSVRPLSGLRLGTVASKPVDYRARRVSRVEDRRYVARLQPPISWRPICWCAASSRPTMLRSSAPASPRPRSRPPSGRDRRHRELRSMVSLMHSEG